MNRPSWRSSLSAVAIAAAMLVGSASPLITTATAESRYCVDLRAQIARAGAGAAQRYRAVAAKQRAEYSRLAARGAAMHCDRQQFLFFGEPPPPGCGPINARLRALADSIAQYDRAGMQDDGAERAALTARYDAQCRNVYPARARQPRNFFEELFGLPPADETTGMREVPVGEPDDRNTDYITDEANEESSEKPQGGSMAICVRSCDGGFFPVSYSARNSTLEDLEALCKALCPNAEVTLYTRSLWRGLEGAVSIKGEPYQDHPNAFKFQKTYDPTCGCKPPDKSWAEALADAEAILAERHKKDQVITAEQAEKLSQPYGPNDPRLKKQKSPPPSPAEATATLPSGGEAGDPALKPSMEDGDGATGEKYREVVGPDGVKRRVRVVAPSL